MNNWTIGDVLVDILGGMDHRGLDSLELNNRLDTFVDMVMGQVVNVCATFHGGAFRGSDLLVIADARLHLLMTSGILFRHGDLVMTMLGCKLLMFVFGWQGSFFLDRLDPVLMMMHLVFASHVLVDFLRLIGSDGLVGRLRLDLGVNGGVVVLARGEDLYQKPAFSGRTSLILSMFEN